jgi:hypothetical protein
MVAAASLPIAYVVTFVVGVPSYCWLRSLGFASAWCAACLGCVTAILAWPTVLILFGVSLGLSFDLSRRLLHLDLDHPRDLAAYAVIVGLGTLVGLTLWVIARPDRTPDAA